MSAEKTPLVNKLNLLVLVLILICLVILIARQNSARRLQVEAPQATQAPVQNAPEPEEPSPVTYSPPTNRAISKATANVARSNVSLIHQPPAKASAGVETSASQNQLQQTPSEGSPLYPTGTIVGAPPGGEVSGRVLLVGTPPAETPIHLDAVCGKLQTKPITTRHYLVSGEGGLANTFVYVKGGLDSAQFPISTNVPVLDNTGCLFEPYVLGVQAGQKFRIHNSDATLHNVNAQPQLSRGFNLALVRKDQVVEKSFPLPEVLIRLKCDVHPWMFAYIGVVRHPFFAVTDSNGVFRLPALLPAGRYTVAASHPKAGEVSQDFLIGEGEQKSLELTLAAPGAR